jgi:hypothetical protein
MGKSRAIKIENGRILRNNKEIGKLCHKGNVVCQIFHEDALIVNPASVDKSFNIKEFWINIPLACQSLSKYVCICAEYGYGNSYITTRTPFNDSIPVSIAMILSDESSQNNTNSRINEAMYVLNQYDSDTCHISCMFDTETINFLKKIPESGGVVCKTNKTDCSQKEVAGELYVHILERRDVRDNSDITAVISIDKKSLSHGKEQEVSVGRSKINFHTHPKQAYKDNGVEKAWPSSTDYLGYLGLGKHTMFHCVITLEGVYIISFTSYWADKLDQVEESFVKKNYNISHTSSMSIQEYVEHINKIKYKDFPIYYLKFILWEKAHSIFSINYAKDNGNCFYSDKHKQKVASLHA